MSKIIGIKYVSFVGSRGDTISGKSIFYSDPIAANAGEGFASDHVFVSSNKLSSLGFTPALGQEVDIFFNRLGHFSTMRLVSDDDASII